MIQPTFSVGHLPKSSLLTPNIPHFLFLKVQKHLTAKRLWNGLCFFIIFNFIGRTDVEAEIPILWPPDAKSLLIWKDPDAGKDWRREEKGTTEGEMVGWHHRLDGHEFEYTLGVGDEQWGLACCSPWGCKELDMTETERLSWTELINLLPLHEVPFSLRYLLRFKCYHKWYFITPIINSHFLFF